MRARNTVGSRIEVNRLALDGKGRMGGRKDGWRRNQSQVKVASRWLAALGNCKTGVCICGAFFLSRFRSEQIAAQNSKDQET